MFDRKVLVLMDLDSLQIHDKKPVEPKILAVFRYKILQTLEEDEFNLLIKKAVNYKTFFNIRNEDKSIDLSHLCNGGDSIPLSKCEIITGDDPRKSRELNIVGKTVVGVLAKCPFCGRRMKVKLNKNDRNFFIGRHRPIGKVKKEMKQLKEKHSKMRRTR